LGNLKWRELEINNQKKSSKSKKQTSKAVLPISANALDTNPTGGSENAAKHI